MDFFSSVVVLKRRRKSETRHKHSTGKTRLAKEKGKPTREEVVEEEVGFEYVRGGMGGRGAGGEDGGMCVRACVWGKGSGDVCE